jgi:SPP1 gp7 family putative phage head morphogenesis protein
MNFREAIQQNRRAVLDLSDPELRSIMPTLYEIREETARELHKFLKNNDLTTKYDLHKHRALMGQLDDAIKLAEKQLPASTLQEMQTTGRYASKISLRNLQIMINAGEQQFRSAVTPLRLNVARILKDQNRKLLIEKFPGSAARYGASVAESIRHDFAASLIRGDSIGQMVRRLTDGQYDRVAKIGPGAVAEKVADGQFFTSQADGERLVRTEMNSLYNDTQIEGIKQADEDDPGWMKMWDAANDSMVCDDCDDLDGDVVEPDEDFQGGVSGPPLHPNDRCSVIPYRNDWPKKL